MTFTEYQKACLRTASMGLGPAVEMGVRALGLCGELEELKRELQSGLGVVVKEGGDVLWYAAALASMFGLDGEALQLGALDDIDAPLEDLQGSSREQVTYAQDAACRLAELVKKQIGHGKPADIGRVKVYLRRVLSSLAAVMPAQLSEVARVNVEKLNARYPKGFDMAIASAKPDSGDATSAPAICGAVSVDGDGRQVEEAEALAEVETVGHYPAGGVGEWKPGPV